MNVGLLEILACPRDTAYPLSLKPDTTDASGEVQTGCLLCPKCRTVYPIIDGIPDLVYFGEDLPESIIKQKEIAVRDKEAKGYYDAHFSDYQNTVETAALLRELDLSSKNRILELGCGTGRISLSLLQTCDMFVGVDFSMDFLRAFKSKIGAHASALLIRADLNHLPFHPLRFFDRIVSAQVFEHLPSHESRLQLLARAAALLSTKGRLVMLTYNYSHVKRMADIPKEGFHRSGIYYYCYTAGELRHDLETQFNVEALLGIMSVMPFGLSERLGMTAGAWIERLFSETRLGLRFGHLLLATCTLPHSHQKRGRK